jgi:hypothetical protein
MAPRRTAPRAAARLIPAALACYPARWRSRHGDEAAEVAELLIRDGTPARSVALSYLGGAARERLSWRPRPGRRVSTAAALLVAAGSLGAPLTLLSSAQAAGAAHTGRPPAVRSGSRATRPGPHGEQCASGHGRPTGARPAAARPGVPWVAISGTGIGHDQGC